MPDGSRGVEDDKWVALTTTFAAIIAHAAASVIKRVVRRLRMLSLQKLKRIKREWSGVQ